MALQAERLAITVPAVAGTVNVPHIQYPSTTGKGFLFFFANHAGGPESDIYSFGVDDGTNRIGSSVGVSQFSGVSLSARGFSSTRSIIRTQSQASFGGAQTILKGYVSAIHVGSFDVTFDLIVNSAGTTVYCVMIGGDDVECAAGLYDVSGGSPGTVNVGFDPVVFFNLSAPDAGVSSEVAGALASYGFATVCDTDHQVGWGIAGGSITSAFSSYQLEDKIQANITAGSTVVSNEVTAAFVTNGFTVTFSGTPNANIGYLAIGGSAVSANLVEIAQPTTTGAQTVSITATDPVIAFFASTCKVATAGAGKVDANLSFGVYDGTNQYAQWWGAVNGASSPFKFNKVFKTTSTILLETATGAGASTINAEATCTGLTTNTIALNWTTADATQRQIWALVLANNLTGSTNPCGDNPTASITVLKQCTPIAGGETEFPFVSPALTPTSFSLLDGESQLFAAVTPGTYVITEDAPSGWAATYASSNGSPHTALTVASGEAVTLTVTNTFATSTPTFRMYRRFALPYDEHYFTYLNRLEIVAQMGVGNGAEPNPTIRIRFSKDGGSTFGDFRTMSLGAAAQYTKRAYINRVGRGRDLVAELICDDPVVVAWVQCLVEGEKATGTN